MKKLIYLLFLVIPVLVSGKKDTVIYFGSNGNLNPGLVKVIKKEIRYQGKKKLRIKTYKIEDDGEILLFTESINAKNPDLQNIQIKGQGFTEKIARTFEKQDNGLYQFTEYVGNKVKRRGTVKNKVPLLLQGEITEYYGNGNIKSVSVYENNQMVSNSNWKENGEKYIDNVFYSVEQEPVYRDGIIAMHREILATFRESAIDLSEVEGRITVGFVVMEDGSVDGIRIEKGLGQQLNDLAVKAINKLPSDWQPARLNGNRVRYYQLFPINFIYQKHDFEFLDLKGNTLYYEIN